MSDFVIKLGLLIFVGFMVMFSAMFMVWVSSQEPMCSMSINVSGDLNAERFGMEEFISNMRIEGISVTAPCGSDGIVNLYNLQYGVK